MTYHQITERPDQVRARIRQQKSEAGKRPKYANGTARVKGRANRAAMTDAIEQSQGNHTFWNEATGRPQHFIGDYRARAPKMKNKLRNNA